MTECPGLPSHWVGLASELNVAPAEVSHRLLPDSVAVHYPGRRDCHDLNALWPITTPTPEEIPALLATWEQEFGATAVKARILCWEEPGEEESPDSPWSAEDAFEGFRLSRLEVLRLVVRSPPERVADLEYRPVQGDDEWREVVELNVAVHGFDDEARAAFCRWMIGVRHRRACEAGRATWWAAWSEGRPVAAAGLYDGGDGPARFQEVLTHPEHRGCGACTSLVSAMLSGGHAEGYLLIADTGSQAHRIYTRLGFRPVARIRELFQRLE